MTAPTPSPDITVYWRPGCPFCMVLTQRLRSAGLEANWVNIWEDADGAAFVRSVNDGNETVPTVVVGDQAMTNPGLAQVQAATTQEPQESGSAWSRLRDKVTGGDDA